MFDISDSLCGACEFSTVYDYIVFTVEEICADWGCELACWVDIFTKRNR